MGFGDGLYNAGPYGTGTGSSSVIPGVGTLSSTALTPEQVAIIFQQLLLQILGVDPDVDQFAYARVRVEYRQEGAPEWLINEDVAFLSAFEVSDPYNLIRDRSNPPIDGDPDNYTQTWTYTRVWEVSFTFYGPHGFDHCRLAKSCMFLDFASDTLALSQLFPQTDFETPRRLPELWANQWFKRTDWKMRMNEFVTETITQPTMASVEIGIYTADGEVSDQTVTL